MKRSVKSRLLSLLLVLAMVISVLPVSIFAADDSAAATLVTDVESLKAGDKIIIAATSGGTTYAAGALSGSILTSVETSLTSVDSSVAVFTLGGTKDAWTLTSSEGQLYANDVKKVNYSGTGSGTWTISIDSDGAATIQNEDSSYGRILYNVTSPRFTTYTSDPSASMLLPSIYKLDEKLEDEEATRENGVVTDLTTLRDGDTVVVFNPANGKALSTGYTGFYNLGTDVTLTDGKLSGYTEADIWTIGINEDGTYTFSTSEGKKLSMGASYSSTPLDDENPDWEISPAATADCFYIKNAVRGYYLEWYESKGNWSAYSSIGSNEALFAQQIYLVVEAESPVDPTPEPEPTPDPTPEKYVGTLISSVEELTSGKYVMVVETGYAPTVLSGTWILAEQVSETGGKIVAPAENLIWTLTVDGTSVTLTDSNGVSIAPVGGNTNGIQSGEYHWAVSCTDGTFQFAGQGDDTVVLASNKSSDSKFRAYKNGTVSGNPAGYPCNFKLYKLEAARQSGVVTDLTTLRDGDNIVVFNPANGKALSSNYTGNYNLGTDVTLTDGVLTGYTDADVWTLGINEDGTYTFSTADGKKLSMGSSYSSTPLDDVNTDWIITAAATENCVYIQNAVRGNYLEWYAQYNDWSSYSKISDEALFAQQIYLVVEDEGSANTGLPEAGDQVVIYNPSAEGVLALQDDNADSPSIQPAGAVIEDGKVLAENGALIFTVEKNGDYFRFYNETFGYLCSNGTGNNAFYAKEASEDADWTLTAGKSGGYNLESRTAKFNGQYSQYLEYYAGAFKTYSMYNVTDYDIYEFFFYPCANTSLTGGVVNEPKVEFGTLTDAYVGVDYTFSFAVDAVFGVAELTVQVGESVLTVNADGTYTIPASLISGESLTITVSGQDTKGTAIYGTAAVTVKDEPIISDLKPVAGSQTGDNKRPVISAAIGNAGEGAEVTMTVNGETVNAAYNNGVVAYIPDADLADGKVTVQVSVTRADGKSVSRSWSFTVGTAQYQLYFGQLHSHTTYSDGSGSLESALEYVANLPESANVDFVAFTDHSNYFDSSSNANPEGALYDMSLASESSQNLWNEYKSTVAAFNESQSEVIAIAGFEMTWSGGPGHINTFNTEGIVSRNNTTLNNKTSDAGMKAYYALLSQTEGLDAISQFNHPGTTFGNFSDFSYWDALIDSRMYLVEVGNGEGAIGAGGYYPSYEQYTMALDKGWHVAPTNNQDNHKGKWGNANDARDVILTDDFSLEGIYEAIRNYRVYATEDKNLEILYTVNGEMMGSIMEEVPEKLTLNVSVFDPDSTDSISKVEVIVNSGKTAYTWDNPTELASGELTVTLDPTYSYYYIRVTEGDGDLAVTAPVWVGDSLKLGFTSVETSTATPVTDEELTVTSLLFNSESSDATIKSMTYTTNGSVVLGVDTTGYTIPAGGSVSVNFNYTPTVAKVMTITVTAVVELDGEEYTFSMDLELDVQDADKLVYIGIDASHHNEYVAGNYKDSMGNFGELAASYSVRTVTLNTSEDLIAACANEKYVAIILTAPSRRDGTALRNPYDTYSDAEIEALVAFNKAGGTLVLCGWGDYYESYSSFPAEDHMAAQQNKVLAALGSSIRISDDETKDDSWNGGQAQRLYLSSYNFDSFLLEGVEYDDENPHNNLYTELYSQYGGASIYVVDADGNATTSVPGTVMPVVYGFDTTYSSDDDKDSYGGLGSIPKYSFDGSERLMVMATEQLEGQGLIVVSGAAFLSNFEVQATVSDSGSEKNYSNYKICENLLQYLNPVQVTDISEVRAQTETGFKYTIEGVVTSNASGYDKDTAFFDCIYVQDETGGICCFPVAGDFRIGDVVRITGTTDFYQGEPELQVTSIEKIGEADPVEPTEITAQQLNDGSVMGSLVTLNGTVVSFELENGLVQTIMVKDKDGNIGRVFIDGYITTGYDVEHLEVGCAISVTGLASYDDTFNAPEGPFPRIRIRDRKDVVCSHVHMYTAETVDPTCTEGGYTVYTCACGDSYVGDVTEALGHRYVDVVTKPTATEKGYTTHTCSVCGDSYVDSYTEPSTNSATGDEFSMVWVGLMAVSLLGAVVLVFDRKKRYAK